MTLVRPYWLRAGAKPAKKAILRPPEAIHEYRDEKGQLVFQRLRWRYTDGSKEVTYRRPIRTRRDLNNPRAWDGWIPEKPANANRYLYRLPELFEAFYEPADSIVWTEGESDADALALAEPDLPVTSHHGGAG